MMLVHLKASLENMNLTLTINSHETHLYNQEEVLEIQTVLEFMVLQCKSMGILVFKHEVSISTLIQLILA